MPTPCNKAAVLRFKGTVNYFPPFCEHSSTTIQPLQNPIQHGVSFNWSNAQDDAFAKAKELISKSPTSSKLLFGQAGSHTSGRKR